MRYTKMHGAGNSFILTELQDAGETGEGLAILARLLCDARTGPGADGLIVLAPDEDADFRMLFYNSDGSVGEMCGNGARCAARYGVEHGFVRDAGDIRIRATAGLVRARRIDAESYEIRLNDPSVAEPHRLAPGLSETADCAYVELGSPGIPHAVVEVEEAAFATLDILRERGRALRHSPAFPRGANVSFACLTGADSVRALTFERGVEDFTLACGTGCGAIALALSLRGRITGGRVMIDMPGGRLHVRLVRENGMLRDLLLTGPTAVVESGEWNHAS